MKHLNGIALAMVLALGANAPGQRSSSSAGRDGGYAKALEIAVDAWKAQNPGSKSSDWS